MHISEKANVRFLWIWQTDWNLQRNNLHSWWVVEEELVSWKWSLLHLVLITSGGGFLLGTKYPCVHISVSIKDCGGKRKRYYFSHLGHFWPNPSEICVTFLSWFIRSWCRLGQRLETLMFYRMFRTSLSLFHISMFWCFSQDSFLRQVLSRPNWFFQQSQIIYTFGLRKRKWNKNKLIWCCS